MPMTMILTTRGPRDELDKEIERISDLLSDLRRIREHGSPPGGVLAAAPLLDDWSPAARNVPCLVGRPQGHPHLSERKAAVTSPLCLLSLEQGFARTASRFWRLGRAATEASDV